VEPVSLVLADYPALPGSAAIVPLGNRGGFSGALVWRLTTSGVSFCLRAGSLSETAAHLRQRHALMACARDDGLPFVPRVLAAASGDSLVERAGRCWEVMDWMPGQADFSSCPSPARLRAAAAALARLHRAWQTERPTLGPCPAVERRLEVARAWNPSSLADPPTHPLLDDLVTRARRALSRRLEELPRLRPWQQFHVPLQPCLRDVWHDHLLFEGEVLSGLVDYAAVGVDSVAADLARMVGSLIGDDDKGWGIALEAYRAERPLSENEEHLARILDRTGVIGGLVHWLRRLSNPGQSLPDVSLVARRMEDLVRRVEAW
jgi:homoserine kinase type II